MAPPRVALIGYGLSGSAFHAPLLAAAGADLAYVVVSSQQRAAAVRRRYPAAHVLGSTDDLWLCDDIDLVVIASPNDSHAPLARLAVLRGLAVVVEKPLAATADDGQQLIELAAARGVPLSVFQNRRWDGDFLTARRLLTEGALGGVVRMESRFDRWRPAVDTSRWRESGDPAVAGGLLFDLGSHLVDQALVLFGPVTGVYAEVLQHRPGAAVDDDVFIALEHAAGVRSHLWASMLAGQPGPRLRLLGDRAAYTVAGLDPQEQQLRDGMTPADPGFGRAARAQWGALTAGDAPEPVPTMDGRYVDFYRGMVAALAGSGPVPVDPADAVAVLRVLDAARRSARLGEVVAPG